MDSRTIARPEVTIDVSVSEAAIRVSPSVTKTDGWRAVHHPRRVVAPAERPREDAVRRDECIGIEPGIPIPSGAVPSRARAASANICSGGIHIGFGQIRQPQAGPTVKLVLPGALVEFLSLQPAA